MQIKFKKRLSVLVSIIFTFMAFSTLTVFAENNGQNSVTRNSQLEKISEEKIKVEVNNAFENEEYVEVLVQLNKQVDTKKVAELSVQKSMKDSTPYQQKIAKRFAVVDALKSTAKITQAELLKYLENQQALGNVEDFKSFYIVNMVYVKATKAVVKDISRRAEIKSISLDKKIQMDWPTRTEVNSVNSTDDTVAWGVDKIEAPAVWNTYGIKGDGVVVGVIDTGLAWEHEALQAKWRGFNPSDPTNPTAEGNWFDAVNGQAMPYEIAEAPHGSHVAGSILGQDPAGLHKIGVAPNAKFITAKAFTVDGGQDSWLLAAGEWMLAPDGNAAMAPDVINNSWGGGPGLDEWYRPMVQAWRNAGILPVFSAGNMPPGQVAPPASVSAPSNYPECFSVGAVDINSQKPDFSRRGPGPYDGDVKPDITGPGVNVTSSVPGGYEGGWNGTSMSAPHVTGLAALLLSADASLTPDDLERIIMETATPLTDSMYPEAPNYGYGHGLINAFDAVSAVASGLGVIKGNVLKEGTDMNAPEVVNHEQLGKLYKGFNTDITVEVKDDIAVTKVNLLLQPQGLPYWIQIPMAKKDGDHKQAIYGAKIPGQLVQEPGFSYKFIVKDYGNNEIESEIFNSEVTFGEVPDEYSTDFSNAPNEWMIMDGEWMWGTPAVGPTVEDGNKLVGTNLNGDYANDGESWFVTPPLDLRYTSYASLSLEHWFNFSDTYELATVRLSNDFGDTWTIAKEFTGPGDGWENLYVDLSEYAESETPVFVAFILQTSLFGTAEGWYLDNVTLGGVDNDAPTAPTNLEAQGSTIGANLNWEKSVETDVEKYQVYRKVGESEFAMIGETQECTYIDQTTEGGITYVYAVKAVDYVGNVSEISVDVSITAPFIVEVYSSDFETDNGGFTTGGLNDSWEWGIPTVGPDAAVSGEKVWGTILAGDYETGCKDYIESPEIDLTGLTTADLTFKQWLKTEARWDFAYLDIKKIEDTTWSRLLEQDGIKGTWETVSLSLNDYAGEKVQLRFILESDVSGNRNGWYIDDVVVTSTTDSAISVSGMNVIESKEIQPEKVEYTINKKLEYNTESNYPIYNENQVNGQAGLPVDAVVTVVETGRSQRVNPLTGEFSIMHPSNDEGESWTLKVEAYGYRTVEESIVLEEDAEVIRNYMLEEIPKGTIIGKIVNVRTNEPVEGAYVRVINDSNIDSVNTDSEGNFVLSNVLEGNWIIKVSHGKYYETEMEVEVVGNEATDMNIQMRPFIGFSDEIAYDDGEDENATVLNDAGNGIAVRMSPNGTAVVKGANIKFYGLEWPSPGGTEVKIAVYDSKESGEPGELVFMTDVFDVVRGEWNYFDLSGYGFATDRDFYMVGVQTQPGLQSPGFCTDESSDIGRSFLYVAGGFRPFEDGKGNAMIRAAVEYEVGAPRITTPTNMSFTNTDEINVAGTVSTESKVNLFVNNELVKELEAVQDNFEVAVTLKEGENTIYATAEVEEGVTDPSATITVIKDTVLPVVTVAEPVDGKVINEEVFTVKASVDEENLDNVKINNEIVQVDEEGNFELKLMLEKGENEITIAATDKAGNESVERVTVVVNKNAPSIEVINPTDDITVKAGDEVKVSFRSDAIGGEAYFNIIASNMSVVNNNEKGIVMTEVEDGLYEGTWVVTEGIALENATVKFEITDVAGNRSEKVAPGRITTADNVKTPIEILNINIKNQFGGIVVEAEIQNVHRVTQQPTLIIVVSDDQNRVVNISTATISELAPGKAITLGSGFNTPEAGNYSVRVLVWDTIEDMNSLAVPMDHEFVIE